MGRKNRGGEAKRLTDVELELMTILWRLGEANVADVIAQMLPGRDLAYTSVSTILRILESKGVISSRKEGRGHIYAPLLGKTEYEASAVRDVVERVFQGAPIALVRQLIDTNQLTDNDVREVRKLLMRARGRK
jgi:predicted transcriptional regulator